MWIHNLRPPAYCCPPWLLDPAGEAAALQHLQAEASSPAEARCNSRQSRLAAAHLWAFVVPRHSQSAALGLLSSNDLRGRHPGPTNQSVGSSGRPFKLRTAGGRHKHCAWVGGSSQQRVQCDICSLGTHGLPQTAPRLGCKCPAPKNANRDDQSEAAGRGEPGLVGCHMLAQPTQLRHCQQLPNLCL